MTGIAGSWARLDASVLHDAAATLRARPELVARYFPADANISASTSLLRFEEYARPRASQQLAALATDLERAAARLSTQPGLGSVADAVRGTAYLAATGSSQVARSKFDAATDQQLAMRLRELTRVADSLEAIAALGRMPLDRATTRERMLALTERPFQRLDDAQLQELSVLADDLPQPLRALAASRDARPLRTYLVGNDDGVLASLSSRVAARRVATLHGRLRHPDPAAATARIEELLARRASLSDDDVRELDGLFRTDASPTLHPRVWTYRDRISLGAEPADLHNALAAAASLQLTRSGDDLDALVRRVLDGDWTDPATAGEAEALLHLRAELGPMSGQGPLFEPHRDTSLLLRGVSGVAPLRLKPNTDRSWVDVTLRGVRTGIAAEDALVRSGRHAIESSRAPARLAELARGEIGAVEALEAQHLTTRLGEGVLRAAAPTHANVAGIALRLAVGEVQHFGGEASRLPLVRQYLDDARAALHAMQPATADDATRSVADQLGALLEHNIARIDGTVANDG